MKRIYEMDESELLALSEETTLKLIDYECALEGVPMLPPSPGPMPQKEIPEPDATVFEIAGFFTMDGEHAARILAAFNSGPLFKESYSGSDYNTKYLEPLNADKYNKPKIETKTSHSPEQWDKIKDLVTAYNSEKSEWDTIHKTYSAALKERAAITKDVYERIREARQRSYDRDCLRNEFARYLELAENNRQIALNFLEKVKDLSDFPELRDEFCPQVGAAAID